MERYVRPESARPTAIFGGCTDDETIAVYRDGHAEEIVRGRVRRVHYPRVSERAVLFTPAIYEHGSVAFVRTGSPDHEPRPGESEAHAE